jgi:predicted ATPase
MRMMADAANGIGGVVVLEGPAGIGKTALVRLAGELAAGSGLQTLRATGSELEAGFPFGVSRQLLERALDALSPDRRAEALVGTAGLADQILGADPRLSAEATELHAAVHALFRLTTNLTRDRPTLIAVDDAHWADLTSLQFLHYLARRIADSPVALLIAARPPAASAGSDPLRALLGVDGVLVLRPAPLSTPAVAELTRRALGADPAPQFVASCAEATGGNAFLLTELLRALAREGTLPSPSAAIRIETLAPEAVNARITGSLATLDDPGLAVVRSLSVLGEAALPLLAQHAGVPIAWPGTCVTGSSRRRFWTIASSCASRIRSSLAPWRACSRRASAPMAISERPRCCSSPERRWMPAQFICSSYEPARMIGSSPY